MAQDALDIILRMASARTLDELKQHVRDVAQEFGYDRIVLFSIAPSREAFIERIYWLEGYWFDDDLDEKTYLQRCPVNRHFLTTSRPFLWCKIGAQSAEGEYRIIQKPLRGALNGIQIPVFGRAGIEGALSLGGTAITASPRAELILSLLGSEAYRHFRRILDLHGQERSAALTARESEVLRLVSQGLKQGDIAGVLRISERTVENHLRRVRSRLGVATTAQAIRVAMLHDDREQNSESKSNSFPQHED